MISKCVLSIDDRRHIEQHVRQTEQNKALLDVIVERNSSTFRVFKAVLRESGYEDIAELLSCDPEDVILYSRTVQMPGTNNFLFFCYNLYHGRMFFCVFCLTFCYINMHIGRKPDYIFKRFVIHLD